jgi:hypothetical protein
MQSNSLQQLLQVIGNLDDQQIPVVLEFISSLKPEINHQTSSSQTVLEKMGGYPEFLLEGSGDLSDRDIRKQAIADIVRSRHQARSHE